MLKPHDIVILLKAFNWQDMGWTYETISTDLGTSKSNVYNSLCRCTDAGFYNEQERTVIRDPLREFLIHGLPYVFYVHPGRLTMGVPTAYSCPDVSELFPGKRDVYIWPSASGTAKGQAIAPLSKYAPLAITRDRDLYVFLSLIDVIRIGDRHEKEIASQKLLEKMF